MNIYFNIKKLEIFAFSIIIQLDILAQKVLIKSKKNENAYKIIKRVSKTEK